MVKSIRKMKYQSEIDNFLSARDLMLRGSVEALKEINGNDNSVKEIYSFYDNDGNGYVLKVYSGSVADNLMGIYTMIKKAFLFALPQTFYCEKKNDRLLVIEELVQGCVLKNHKVFKGMASIDEIVEFAIKLCNAVGSLHSLNPSITHCDLSANNIIVDSLDAVKIIDLDRSYVENSGRRMPEGTRGYVAPEVTNDIPCVQSDIYSIACIIEKCVSNGNILEKTDSKTRKKLVEIIKKGKESELKERYKSTFEMKEELIKVQILYILNKALSNFKQEGMSVFGYEYVADNKEFKELAEECDDLLYVIKDERKGNYVLFESDSLKSVYKKARKSFMPPRKIAYSHKIIYSKLIGVRAETQIPSKHKQFDVVVGEDSGEQWELKRFDIKYIDADIVCTILEQIIACRNTCFVEDDIIEYYEEQCKKAYELLSGKKDKSERYWWDIIILLGEKAHGLNERACKDILIRMYDIKERHAILENDKKVAETCELRIRELRADE